jgi:hypothetical protein
MTTPTNYGQLKDRVLTWANRAAMARKQNADDQSRQEVLRDLMRQALDRCWEYQKELAPHLNVDVPPKPESPEEVWQWLGGQDVGPTGSGPSRPGDPYQPSGVPRKPLPFSGAGAVALPLPEKEDDH